MVHMSHAVPIKFTHPEFFIINNEQFRGNNSKYYKHTYLPWHNSGSSIIVSSLSTSLALSIFHTSSCNKMITVYKPCTFTCSFGNLL